MLKSLLVCVVLLVAVRGQDVDDRASPESAGSEIGAEQIGASCCLGYRNCVNIDQEQACDARAQCYWRCDDESPKISPTPVPVPPGAICKCRGSNRRCNAIEDEGVCNRKEPTCFWDCQVPLTSPPAGEEEGGEEEGGQEEEELEDNHISVQVTLDNVSEADFSEDDFEAQLSQLLGIPEGRILVATRDPGDDPADLDVIFVILGTTDDTDTSAMELYDLFISLVPGTPPNGLDDTFDQIQPIDEIDCLTCPVPAPKASSDSCVPRCDGSNSYCGDDGCNGVCTCDAGHVCDSSNALCVSVQPGDVGGNAGDLSDTTGTGGEVLGADDGSGGESLDTSEGGSGNIGTGGGSDGSSDIGGGGAVPGA